MIAIKRISPNLATTFCKEELKSSFLKLLLLEEEEQEQQQQHYSNPTSYYIINFCSH
jgi:hypothetical protein